MTALNAKCEVEADESGFQIHEHSSGGHSGASGNVGIPPNVLMWLMQAVRL
jgi:hypothetical protein